MAAKSGCVRGGTGDARDGAGRRSRSEDVERSFRSPLNECSTIDTSFYRRFCVAQLPTNATDKVSQTTQGWYSVASPSDALSQLFLQTVGTPCYTSCYHRPPSARPELVDIYFYFLLLLSYYCRLSFIFPATKGTINQNFYYIEFVPKDLHPAFFQSFLFVFPVLGIGGPFTVIYHLKMTSSISTPI